MEACDRFRRLRTLILNNPHERGIKLKSRSRDDETARLRLIRHTVPMPEM